MASVTHLVTVLQKDGKTTKQYVSSTANINEGDEFTAEHVLHHYTKAKGEHNGSDDPVRFTRIFGKNADKIIKIEKGTSAFVPPEVAALVNSGKLPASILGLAVAQVANVVPPAKQATAPATVATTQVLPTAPTPSTPATPAPVEVEAVPAAASDPNTP